MADELNGRRTCPLCPWGRLADAADALETGDGTVHERLFEAFTHLVLISPEDVPDGELRLLSAS